MSDNDMQMLDIHDDARKAAQQTVMTLASTGAASATVLHVESETMQLPDSVVCTLSDGLALWTLRPPLTTSPGACWCAASCCLLTDGL